MPKLYIPEKFVDTKFGLVLRCGEGVAVVSGLSRAVIGGLVTFVESGVHGLVLSLFSTKVHVAVLGNETLISQRDLVRCNKGVASISVNFGILGTAVNALGVRIDGGKSETSKSNFFSLPLMSEAPGITLRQAVKDPLVTGSLIIDVLTPIGRGQRELIVGDRQTGKTTVAVDTIINQTLPEYTEYEQIKKQVFCIYVSIGQKRSSTVFLYERLRRFGALHHTVFVAATASESPALQFLSPYTGCSIGEFFRDYGLSSLVVYDDLTKHAFAYRQMSLILRKTPGREAYPGDIFYLHSRLLERASKLSKFYGGGSLTAFPIVVTEACDLSAFIPTNIISITDGQIFLDSYLVTRNVLPAFHMSLSVSRVGSKAQPKILREASAGLKSALTSYRVFEGFSFLESEVDDTTKQILHRGLRLTSIIKQQKYYPFSVETQVILLFAVFRGYFDCVKDEWIEWFRRVLIRISENFGYKIGLHWISSKYAKLEHYSYFLHCLISNVLVSLNEHYSILNE